MYTCKNDTFTDSNFLSTEYPRPVLCALYFCHCQYRCLDPSSLITFTHVLSPVPKNLPQMYTRKNDHLLQTVTSCQLSSPRPILCALYFSHCQYRCLDPSSLITFTQVLSPVPKNLSKIYTRKITTFTDSNFLSTEYPQTCPVCSVLLPLSIHRRLYRPFLPINFTQCSVPSR